VDESCASALQQLVPNPCSNVMRVCSLNRDRMIIIKARQKIKKSEEREREREREKDGEAGI
jgi:hypothetical protein